VATEARAYRGHNTGPPLSKLAAYTGVSGDALMDPTGGLGTVSGWALNPPVQASLQALRTFCFNSVTN